MKYIFTNKIKYEFVHVYSYSIYVTCLANTFKPLQKNNTLLSTVFVFCSAGNKSSKNGFWSSILICGPQPSMSILNTLTLIIRPQSWILHTLSKILEPEENLHCQSYKFWILNAPCSMLNAQSSICFPQPMFLKTQLWIGNYLSSNNTWQDLNY